MNREELIRQRDKIQAELDRLTELINKPVGRWKPEYGEIYFFLTDRGTIEKTYWNNGVYDNHRHNIGNCYSTEDEVRDYNENLLTKQRLKDLAVELNNNVEPNWKNINQLKYYIYLNPKTHELAQSFITTYKDVGIYCLDDKLLNIAKQRIGEEKIIKLIKSGV